MKMKTLTKLILSVIIIIAFSALSFGRGSNGYFKNIQNEKFVYKFEKGKEYKYSAVDDIKTSMTSMGQEMTYNVKSTGLYTYKVIDILNDGNFLLNIVIDSLKIEADNPMATRGLGDIDILNGKTYKAIMTKTGEIKESKLLGIDTLPEGVKQAAVQYNPKRRQFLIQFQENLSKIGDSCASQPYIDSSNTMGMKISTSIQVALKVIGQEKKNGYDVYKISGEIKTKISGSGETNGASVAISGEGKTTGEYFFAQKEGLLVGYKTEQNMDMTIDMSAMGMTMPMNTITSTTVTLIK
jgi:hypothetical protein